MSRPSSSEVETSTLMHERRPEWLRTRIEQRFQNLPRNSTRYRHKGVHGDYAFGDSVFLFDVAKTYVSTVARELEAERGKLDILDIGAAGGALVSRYLQSGHRAQGISGMDYRTSPTDPQKPGPLVDDVYILGDVHHLDELPGLNPEFDLITSRFTFIHLTDPLSVLEQALRRLRPGGVLLADRFRLDNYQYGMTGEQAIDTVREQGLEVVESGFISDAKEVTHLVVKAPTEPLDVRFGIQHATDAVN